MKKIIFLICVLFFNTLLFADCIVYENRTYAETGAETYRKTCNEFGGGVAFFRLLYPLVLQITLVMAVMLMVLMF
jgi:hypothetical protein